MSEFSETTLLDLLSLPNEPLHSMLGVSTFNSDGDEQMTGQHSLNTLVTIDIKITIITGNTFYGDRDNTILSPMVERDTGNAECGDPRFLVPNVRL
jgi:hypothetical protein